MRLINFGQREDYQPIARGEALPQFYENGDAHRWHQVCIWNWHFWHLMKLEAKHNFYPNDDETGMLLAGGEL